MLVLLLFSSPSLIFYRVQVRGLEWPKQTQLLAHSNVLQFSSCGAWRVFSHSNSPSHHALGQYRHTSSSRQFHNILCWLEFLNYCPDGGHWNVHCSSSFLKATSLICEAQLSFAAHSEIYSLFFLVVMDGWVKGIWALFSFLFIFLWNRKP